MTTKKEKVLDLTADQYKERYSITALRQMLEFAARQSSDHDVMREVPKIREALGIETLSTAEIRESYAWGYAVSRDPIPYTSDLDAGRAEFDAWLADHDSGK